MRTKQNNKGLLPIIVLALVIFLANFAIAATPTNPTIISNTSSTAVPKPSLYLNTTGGSFTTLVFNATSQNYKWKAYVGNVTGKLTLDDALNYTIYDWRFTTITGRVYASRNSSIDWNGIKCANRTTVVNEDVSLNISSDSIDSINSTFNMSIHKRFYAANTLIQNSTCPAIATYVNDSSQVINESSKFQEVLLQDNRSTLVYTTIIDAVTRGYDNNYYDFQMILANDETKQAPTPYYFYVELG